MAENSGIEWTDHTFNPWMGCTKVSPACVNCYAERDMDHRYGKVAWGPGGTRLRTTDANWRKPIKWNRDAAVECKRVRVFCASLADVFEDWQGEIHYGGINGGVAAIDNERTRLMTMDDCRADLFALIDATQHIDWLLLTKRPENFERMWDGKIRGNVWLGTSIENQEWADRRLPYLHHAKRMKWVAKTFVSAEPLVGPIVLNGNLGDRVMNHLGGIGLNWVITGGESGPAARPCNPDWFRSLRDQCARANVPFHFKQWGEYDSEQKRVGKKAAGRILDGETHDGIPISSHRINDNESRPLLAGE